MASKPDPPAVPHINTPSISTAPVRVASPDGGYFPAVGPRTPTRSASPATPAIRPTTPVPLLRTPPVEPQSPSHSRPRTDTPGEALTLSLRSSARITRAASPSDNRPATLSPSVSSSGWSFYSSDTGYSPCSLSSSEYLKPPQFQPDCDKKPYKARRQSSDSLSMVRTSKRAKTMPYNRTHKSRKRHRRSHKCRHGKGRKHGHSQDHWCLPGCHVAPTAPKGMKELCEGYVGRYRPILSIHGNTDTFGRVLPRLRSDPALPVVTRRWSSVEVGYHQIRLASTLPAHSVASTPGNLVPENECIPRRLSRPYRSSTFTSGAIDHDIVRTVRERLTFREMPSTHIQTPATITLRRASGASGTVDTLTEVLTPKNGPETGGTTPRPYPRSQADRETDTAYLITRKEIDSITELIEANLRRNYRSHNCISAHPPDTPPRARLPAFTLKGMVPKSPSPSESTVTIMQAKSSRSRTPDNLDHLQVTATPQTRPRELSRTASQQSTHEIIWEAGGSRHSMRGSPSSMSSLENGERRRFLASNSSSPQETVNVTPHQPKIKPLESPRLTDKSGAFDPNNARASISEWSWRLPPAEIPLIVTSSDSDSNDLTPASDVPPAAKPRVPIRSVVSAPEVPKTSAKGKARAFVRQAVSSPEIEDVVSFPPLPPRKTTNDWYSPLPDIVSSPPKCPSIRSLYDEGIDATRVVPIHSPASKPQRLPFLPLTDAPSPLPSPCIEFNPDYDLRPKSLIKAHPHTPARVGSQSAMGSSIGASSGERRRSSARLGLQRVQTIDNIHKGQRAGTWTRNRPPSICPPPKTPSPTELEDDSDNSIHTGRSAKIGSALGERPRLKSLKPVKGPPVPKVDKAGIYGKITGTVRSALGLNAEDCKDECPPRHDCDDCAMDPRNPSVDWIG